MEERINKKLSYLYDMSEKYHNLNLKANINNEWDKTYQEDLKESKGI